MSYPIRYDHFAPSFVNFPNLLPAPAPFRSKDQILADNVSKATGALSDAVFAARAAGLTVDFSVGVGGCTYNATPGTFRLKEVSRTTTTKTVLAS